MRGRNLLAGGGLLLAACSASPERPDGGALAAIATPVHLVLKGAACLATAVVAAPVASAVALADRPDRAVQQRALEAGLAANCGGPWTLAGS